MKQHYTRLKITAGMDVTRMANARPVCGQRPKQYLGAVTNDWDRVDCKLCLQQRPHPTLRPGQAVQRGRDGVLGIITDSPSRGGTGWGVMWVGANYAVIEQQDNLTAVTLTTK